MTATLTRRGRLAGVVEGDGEAAPGADGRVAALQRALLTWFEGHARPLAWRTTTDPYRILVSEVMAQQTQVARVEPAYRRFIEAFPDLIALAAAPAAEVLRHWKGLGYNRRALALHRAAQTAVERHGGLLPDDLDALMALPGIGPYTARAVLVFAHGRDLGPVDTNVSRVLARAVAGEPLSARAAQELADEVVPAGAGAAWSGALMDLGATTCTARTAHCARCPIALHCRWGGDPAVADPAAGSALRPRPQATFSTSDRRHRGRLLDALREGPVARAELAAAAHLPADPARAERIAEALVRDGLAERDAQGLRLPR